MSPEESPPPMRTSKRKGKGRKKKLPWPRSQIKRIMQSDDYVGQVNQKVVEAMSAAMHGFTTHILDKAIDVCKEKDLRKIDEGVLKQVFNHDDKLDFLRELARTLKTTKRKRNPGKPGVDHHDQVRHRQNNEAKHPIGQTRPDATDEDASDEGSGDDVLGGSRTNVEQEEKIDVEPVMYPDIMLPKRTRPQPRDDANGYASSGKLAHAGARIAVKKEDNANASNLSPATDQSPKRRRLGSSPTHDSKSESPSKTVPFSEQVKKRLKPASRTKMTSLDSGSDSDY